MNRLILLLGIYFLLPGFVAGEGKTFTIDGSVKELTEGEMLVISNRIDRVDTLGRGKIENGRFRIQGELTEPCVALLKVDGYGGGFVFLLDTDAPYEVELWQSGKNSIKGGKLQGELNAYQEIVGRANVDMGKLREEMNKAEAQKHFKTVGELKKKIEKVKEKAQKELDVIVERNKDNLFAAYIQTAGMGRMDLAALKQCYERLSEKARQTEPAKMLAARIATLENVNVNAVAPDFTLQTPDGKSVAMYSVKGKLKIIDFWASWCGPCRQENPNMVKLYNEFKDKGLFVISVSLDEKKNKWEEAIEKDGLTWLHLSDLKGWQSDVVKKYNIDAVPTIFVLDENNRIIAKNLRGEKLRAFVSEQLK